MESTECAFAWIHDLRTAIAYAIAHQPRMCYLIEELAVKVGHDSRNAHHRWHKYMYA
jgi:hypothetical protein